MMSCFCTSVTGIGDAKWAYRPTESDLPGFYTALGAHSHCLTRSQHQTGVESAVYVALLQRFTPLFCSGQDYHFRLYQVCKYHCELAVEVKHLH